MHEIRVRTGGLRRSEGRRTATLEELKAGASRREIVRDHQEEHRGAGNQGGATWRDWYTDRHATFGVSVNNYTAELAELRPDWKPDALGAGERS